MEISNMAFLFFGGSLNDVTVLVIPVINDGTNVGIDSDVCQIMAKIEKHKVLVTFSSSQGGFYIVT
jgi:hypothetical protein